MIWRDVADKIEKFFRYSNSSHHSIKWTYTVENKGRILFFDLETIKKPSGFHFRVYRKNTHTNVYLRYSWSIQGIQNMV